MNLRFDLQAESQFDLKKSVRLLISISSCGAGCMSISESNFRIHLQAELRFDLEFRVHVYLQFGVVVRSACRQAIRIAIRFVGGIAIRLGVLCPCLFVLRVAVPSACRFASRLGDSVCRRVCFSFCDVRFDVHVDL